MRPAISKPGISRSNQRHPANRSVLWAAGLFVALSSGQAISGERAQSPIAERAVAPSAMAEQRGTSVRFQHESKAELSFWERFTLLLVGTKSDDGDDTDPYPKTGG